MVTDAGPNSRDTPVLSDTRLALRPYMSLREEAARLGVKYLTLYTFSTENWNRPVDEVAALMSLLMDSIEEETFMKNNISFRIIGETEKLPENVLARLNKCIERTSKNTGMCLTLALSYSSKWEITEAVKKNCP